MTRRFFGLALLLALLAVGQAGAQDTGFAAARPEERYFTVDVGLRDGGSVAEGYVINRYDNYATRVGVVLQPVDAAGRPLGTVTTDVRDVPSRNRAYFRIRLPAAAAGIRGSVASYDWAPRGGGS